MAGEVAHAYVTLIPSARGFRRRLQSQLNGPVTAEGERAGRLFGEGFSRRVRGYFTTGFVQRLKKNFTPSLAGVLTGLSPLAVPALAATAGAVGAVGSALAAAGIGAAGFAAIAIPAFSKVHAVTQQVAAAQRAYNLATTSSARQAALRREQAALATLTPGERELAKVLGTLSSAWGKVERQLQPTVVKALVPWVGALKVGLGFLAPVVRPASAAIKELGRVAKADLAGPFWGKFFRQIGQFGGKAIESFGLDLMMVGRGIASLVQAFLPLSARMLPVLGQAASKFADWAASLSGSRGFKTFIAYVTANGPKLMSVLGSIVQIAGKLIVGLAPLGALLLSLLKPLGQFLAKLSPNALMAIALGIAAALAVATGGFTAIVTVIVLVAALIVRNWSHIKSFILGVVGAIVSWVRGHWKLLVAIIGGPIAAIVVLIVSHWNRIRSVTMSAWRAVVASIRADVAIVRGVLNWFGSLPGKFGSWFGRAASAAIGAVGRLLGYVRGIPGRILSALGNLGSLLYQAGRNIVQGLINGVLSMIGSVGSAIGSIASKIRGFLPFSPAKEGPLAGAGSPEIAGRKIAAMLAGGMTAEVPSVAGAAARLAASAALVPDSAGAASMLAGATGGAAGTYHLHFDGLTRGAIEAHVRAGLQAAAVAERRRLRPGRAA